MPPVTASIPNFSRRDTSVLGRWWWTIDRWNLSAVFLLMILGILLSFAASPAVAERLNLGNFYFVKRHLLMMPFALGAMVCVSFLKAKNIRKLSLLGFAFCVVALVLTLLMGIEVKGAQRWITFLGFSLQASEFIKPFFAILIAWTLATAHKNTGFPGLSIALGLLVFVLTLLLLQPDLGMSVVITSTWIAQLFVAGMPIAWMVMLGCVGLLGILGAYILLPHVAKRMDQFFDPTSVGDVKNELYQIQQSLDAFAHGGFFGKGPGEGIVKKFVPDAHADFVFAVAGEEFGLFLCLFIVLIFAFIVIRSLIKCISHGNLFNLLGVVGVMTQFGLQAIINMASSLHLIPTKGMTMPFVSYGGSSLIALGIALGMMFSFTRKSHGSVVEG